MSSYGSHLTTPPRSRAASRSSSPLLEVPPHSHVNTLLAMFLTSDTDDMADFLEMDESDESDEEDGIEQAFGEIADMTMNIAEQVAALTDASERLLHMIQGQGSLNNAALPLESDLAIVQLGPSHGPSLSESSRRLLRLVQSLSSEPDTSVLTDLAVVRVGGSSPREQVHDQGQGQRPLPDESNLSLGDREILRDVREIRAAYLEQTRRLKRIIRSLPPQVRGEQSPVDPQDPSIVRRSSPHQVCHQGQGPRDNASPTTPDA